MVDRDWFKTFVAFILICRKMELYVILLGDWF